MGPASLAYALKRFPEERLCHIEKETGEGKGRPSNRALWEGSPGVLTLELGPGHSYPFIVILYTLHVFTGVHFLVSNINKN